MPEEKYLDLAGVCCPMNFVRIKIALSRMPGKDTIRVRLDSGAVAEDVKRTLIEQGYRVLSLEPDGDFAIMNVRKD